MKRNILLVSILCFLFVAVEAQNRKAAIKLCEKAKVELNAKNFEKAKTILDKAILKDSTYHNIYFLLGDIYNLSLKSCEAAEAYNHALRLTPKPRALDYISVAGEEMKCGKYEEAYNHYQTFLAMGGNSTLIEEVNNNIITCKFGMEAVKHPVNMNPINMGSAINSEHDEYLATLTADEQEIIYTVRRPRDENTACVFCKTEEDFYWSKKADNQWQPRKSMETPINSSYNEGAQSISPDGHYLFYTLCNSDQGYGSCDLYWAKRIGNRWSRPRNFGNPVNSSFWESQPTIAPDGKTIYFASNRPGGYGGLDLWKTTMTSEGTFSEPVNLGSSINTENDETAPFIHPDGSTIYFASNGHPGMGGRDLFFATLLADSSWNKPVNLGYPINTPADELNIFINATGDVAYYASDKDGGEGGLDLYYFILDEHLRPTPVTYMKGKITDKESGKPLEANIELIDLNKSKTITSTISDPETGEFLACILTGSNLMLNISHPFYLFYSENFKLTETADSLKPFLKDIYLQKPQTGSSIVMRNIFFDFNQSTLQPESFIELDYLVEFLKNNKEIKIEISGHTDNQGSDDINDKLSLERAQSVYNYVVSKGISLERLTYKGYGKRKPIADNDTEEGRAQNRRTEITILEN